VIRVFLAFDDAAFGQRLFEYLNEQPDFQVCGRVEIGDEAVREALELRPDIAILEMAAADDLQVANAFKQHIPRVPLLLVAEEALALNVRALYDLMGNRGDGDS
jgi:two-component system response regulator DesR